jgi:hypothetical protein
MSRMGKGRGEARVEDAAASDEPQPRRRRGSGAPAAGDEGDFVRAFADALRDILTHERRRAA